MNVIYERCCGMDVHKNTIVACVITGKKQKEIRTFSTMTSSLLRLIDWLKGVDCQCVAMEATGSVLETNLQSFRNGGHKNFSC